MINRGSSLEFFLNPIRKYLIDKNTTELVINESKKIFILSGHHWEIHFIEECTQDWLRAFGVAAAGYTGQVWDEIHPLLSAYLPSGERIQLVMPPAVEHERISLTIRKPSSTTFSMDDLEEMGLFDKIVHFESASENNNKKSALHALLTQKKIKEFLCQCVIDKLNIVVSGATGSGKTTLMKALTMHIPLNERLITIEDVRELILPHDNKVHLLYSKGGHTGVHVSPKILLESCLRMRPDRILLAELRGDECLYFIRNAVSGHPGCITSCHAGTIQQAKEQLAIMIQDSPAGAAFNYEVIKNIIHASIDVFIQMQNHNGNRFISEIMITDRGLG